MKYPLIRLSYYRTLLKEISAYVIKPSYPPNRIKSTKEKVIDMIGLFVLKMACIVLLALLMGLISTVHDPVNLSKSNMHERFSPLLLLLVGGFILPTVEEVCFRLSLRFKPIYLSLTLTVITYYILTKGVYGTSISMVDESFMLRIGTSLFVGLFCFPLLKVRSVRTNLEKFLKANFRWFYYSTCLIFAWIHIFNYELSVANLLLLPLITSPQLLSSIIYGYARVAFGFQYPLLFHVTNNLIGLSISLLPLID